MVSWFFAYRAFRYSLEGGVRAKRRGKQEICEARERGGSTGGGEQTRDVERVRKEERGQERERGKGPSKRVCELTGRQTGKQAER